MLRPPVRPELGDAGMQTAEPALVRQPFLDHSLDGPQSPQYGPQMGAVGKTAGTFRWSVRRPIPKRC